MVKFNINFSCINISLEYFTAHVTCIRFVGQDWASNLDPTNGRCVTNNLQKSGDKFFNERV